jgi:hypothetical protein
LVHFPGFGRGMGADRLSENKLASTGSPRADLLWIVRRTSVGEVRTSPVA